MLLPLLIVRDLWRRRRLRGRVTLLLRLGGGLGEASAGRVPRGPEVRTFPQVMEFLSEAVVDPAVNGLALTLDELHIGWARVFELRRGLAALRATGRRVEVHLAHGGLREYLVASVAHRVTLAPEGQLPFSGLRSEMLFVRDLLSRLGVEAEFVAAGEYKSFGEMFTRDEPSPASREAMESLLLDLHRQAVEAMAEGRGLDLETAARLLDDGPWSAGEAVGLGLVDATCYPDQLSRRRRGRWPEGRIEVAGGTWLRGRLAARSLRAWLRNQPVVAVLPAIGRIADTSAPGPLQRAEALSPRPFAEALHRLASRADVAAIVVRVDSPGGSAAASDLLWRAVRRARMSKPVVVSFGDVAASGGYYLAMGADRILAEGATLTGSIGVVAGRFDLAGLYGRIGVRKVRIGRGSHPGLHSDHGPLTDAERAKLRDSVDRAYATFLRKAARGRRRKLEEIAPAAGGRVWTGAQALEKGLVDALGGLGDAIVAAAMAAGIRRFRVRFVSERRPGLQRLIARFLLPRDVVRVLAGASPTWPFRSGEPLALLPFEPRRGGE